MTDISPEAQSKSGLILKAAREEMSLTLEQVANELHLRPSVIKSIEEENYDEFSSDVFLKGYFRTYCRLVNLHETRMMDLLEQQLTVRQKLVEQTTDQANKVIQNKKRKKLFITLVVFLVCLSLITFAYQIASSTNNESLENINAAQEALSSEFETTSKQKSTSAEINTIEVHTQAPTMAENVNTLNNDVNPIEKASEDLLDTQLDEVDLASSAELLPSVDQEETVEVQVTDEVNDILTESQYSANIVASLKVSFTGECWFKVTDSSGKAVIAALKKEDDEINFQGSAPFHIVIGDASQVTLFFQDELVNLKPFTSRNGRAELTLKPSDIDNEG